MTLTLTTPEYAVNIRTMSQSSSKQDSSADLNNVYIVWSSDNIFDGANAVSNTSPSGAAMGYAKHLLNLPVMEGNCLSMEIMVAHSDGHGDTSIHIVTVSMECRAVDSAKLRK